MTLIKRADVENALRELRPGCDMQWANESMLAVEGLALGFSAYMPRFTVTFFNFPDRDTDFDGLVFRTQFASEAPIPPKFVNDLNTEFSSVRHSTRENRLVVEMDVVLGSKTLTQELLELNYSLFSIATERLDSMLSDTKNEKVD